MNKLHITDLMSVELLQQFQDTFSEITGLPVIMTDADGNVITEGSNVSGFCWEHMKNSPEGSKRCRECSTVNAIKAFQTGAIEPYFCHAGLMDFSAPIVLNGEMIGCMNGGQVLTSLPEKDKIYELADDVGMDRDELWESILNVPVLPFEEVDRRAKYMGDIAKILSSMAYSSYLSKKAKEDIERAGDMKSNFLANMSHEIRTPMNAVIGLSEMALRENLPPAARDYINQIKSSGRVLLGIINDVLDFSKIESGKMDIIPVEFEALSIVNDVANVISVKLGEKNVELLLDVNPSFPSLLYGDNIRIKQVITNIANNAVKFTREGYVKLILDYEKIDDETIDFQCAVMDTGIGIKDEDKPKLFKSFNQLDSKRNRNIEGSGLGLAISKQLLSLMGGEISFISEYEKGTTFFISLKLKVLDWKPSVELKDSDKLVVLSVFKNPLIDRQIGKDLRGLGAEYYKMDSWEAVTEDLLKRVDDKPEKAYILTEKDCMGPELDEVLRKFDDVNCLCFENFTDDVKSSFPNLKIVKRPISVMKVAMLINGEEFMFPEQSEEAFEMDFEAPDAKILIVDDNPVNLTVAEGLLEPLRMKITTATSGKEAIKLIESSSKFDLIFMDHMMPELDGVETTRIIRRLHPSYDDVPVIALTANAISGAKEMFMKEGMNDFVAKPIEVRFLAAKVKQWLPEKLLKKRTAESNAVPAPGSSENAVLSASFPGIDFTEALQMVGNERLFVKILKEYYRTIPTASASIKEAFDNKDIKQYTILVHALKSSSRQIGAKELGDMAYELEMAGNAGDEKTIEAKTPYLLNKYISYKKMFEPYFAEDKQKNDSLPKADPEKTAELLDKMVNAAELLNMDMMEEVMEELKGYHYTKKAQELLEKLSEAVANVDVDTCEELCDKWKKQLNRKENK